MNSYELQGIPELIRISLDSYGQITRDSKELVEIHMNYDGFQWINRNSYELIAIHVNAMHYFLKIPMDEVLWIPMNY